MKNLLFTLPKSEMKEIYTKQKKKEPEPLTAQFSHRLLREDAIKRQKERQQKTTELFPSGTFNLCSQEHLVNNWHKKTQSTIVYWYNSTIGF